MIAGSITLYYWPVHARCGALVAMLEEKGVAYEHVADKAKMPCAAFGAADSVNIAPPVIKDGDKLISQSTACTMYLGKRLGFDKGVDDCLALQYLCDIVDWSENGIGKNNEDAFSLKKYMDGVDGQPSRFSIFAGCVERNIQGPYFFGAEPSYVDFFLLQHMDWRQDLFDKLQAVTSTDPLAAYPKIKGVVAGLRTLPSYKNFKGGPCGGWKYFECKQDIIDAYSKL